MQQLLPLLLWLPFVGYLLSLFVPGKKESILSGIAMTTTGVHLIAILSFTGLWIAAGHETLNIKHIQLFQSEDNLISVDFYFDKITAVFAAVGSFLTFFITIFSKYYIHRDHGFKRYFNVIMLFFFAYNMVVFSGNFETLFIGWELLGVCTFLLVAFYRERYLPVKNSLKVISVYRLGDICLILAMGMNHHTWHENVIFLKLSNFQHVEQHLQHYYWDGVFISVMIVIASAVKSAQLPFSTWLPRAMEGPTTSSAIFYGSLTVHIGVFLLLRTYPYWESLTMIKALVIFIGLVTSIVCNNIAKVQSALKAKIAYSSSAQLGIIFVEVALGFHAIALAHFAGNAFLRTYQLLVSPSVQSYLIHHMFFHFQPRKPRATTKMQNTLYLLALKEWNLDKILKSTLWDPFKFIGKQLQFLNTKIAAAISIKLFFSGLYCYYFESSVPVSVFNLLPYFYGFFGTVFIIRSFSVRENALWAWFYIVMGQLYTILSVALQNENFKHNEIFLYLSGSIVSLIVGAICLKKMQSVDGDINLNRFHGYVYEKPGLALLFLLCCLGLAGLPFTPTFIGVDLLFSHIEKSEIVLISFVSITLVFIELSVLRIYARLFLGQHKKMSHPLAYRSS